MNPHPFAYRSLAALACWLAVGFNSGFSSPAETVLFPFDDVGLPFNKGLLLTLVPGRKSAVDHGTGRDPAHPNRPVVMPGQPGDPDNPVITFIGSVIHIGDGYRMWYIGESGNQGRVCYAVSRDGLAWEKPKLGLAQFNGKSDNNLVLLDGKGPVEGSECLVLYEADDPDPARRYKMIYEINPMRIMAAFSPDGLRWTSSANNPVIKGGSLEPGGLVKFRGCYYVNGQGGPIPYPIPGAKKRVMVTRASYDFDHWTQAGNLGFRRDPIPPRAPSDFEFHRGEQVHEGASLWDRGNVLIGLYGQYHDESNDRRMSSIDLGLLVSNDAVHFREPVVDFKMIPSYEEEDGADGRLLQGEGFENIGERTIVWYGIWPESPNSPTGIRIATWVRDRLGFFSPGPRIEDAHCISSAMALPAGARIYLNADGLSEASRLEVELLDERFEPLPGFSGTSCVPVDKPGLRQPVAWRGDGAVPKHEGLLRLRVNWAGKGRSVEDAKLYALYAEPATGGP